MARKLHQLSLVLLVIVASGCTHPIEVSGDGRVISASGSNECSEDRCEFSIAGEYDETYTAIANDGSVFVGWDGCIELIDLITEYSNQCAFSIPENAVRSNWLKTMPTLRANFTRRDTPATTIMHNIDQFGTQHAQGRSILLTDDGGVIFAGTDHTGPFYTAYTDGYLRKVNELGHEVWSVRFDESNINAVSSIFPSLDTSDFFVLSHSNMGAELSRYKEDSELLWRKSTNHDLLEDVFQARGSREGLHPSSVVWTGDVDSGGNIVLVGKFLYPQHPQNGTLSNGSVVSKWSGNDGSLIWSKLLEPSNWKEPALFPESSDIIVNGVAHDANNNLIMSGYLRQSRDSELRDCLDCAFMLSFDTNGSLRWKQEIEFANATCIEDESNHRSLSVAVAPNGTAYLYGATYPKTSRRHRDARFLAKFDLDDMSLNWIDCKPDSPDATNQLYLTSEGDLLLYEKNYVYTDTSTVRAEAVLTKYNADGNSIWKRTIDGSVQGLDTAQVLPGSVAQDSTGKIYLTGSYEKIPSTEQSEGDWDMFLLQYDN